MVGRERKRVAQAFFKLEMFPQSLLDAGEVPLLSQVRVRATECVLRQTCQWRACVWRLLVIEEATDEMELTARKQTFPEKSSSQLCSQSRSGTLRETGKREREREGRKKPEVPRQLRLS